MPLTKILKKRNFYQEFCVDISSYGPVEWEKEEVQECKTSFVKECTNRTEEVCGDVSETSCQVIRATSWKLITGPN